MKSETSDFRTYTALSVAMFLWASSFLVFKIGFRYYTPFFIIWGRMLTASLLFVFFIRKFRNIRVEKADIKFLLLMGIFEPCIYFLFELFALVNTDAAQAGMITSLNPLMIAVTSYFFLKEKLDIRTAAGMIIAAAGVIFLSISGNVSETAPNPVLGNFFEFAAMISAAFYTVFLKKMSSRYSPLFLTAVQSFTGLVFFTPFMFIKGIFPRCFSVQGTVSILYLGVFISGAAYGCYNFAVSRIPANRAGAAVNLIPVICLVMAVLVLHERLNGRQFLSSCMVIAGVLSSQYRKNTQPEF